MLSLNNKLWSAPLYVFTVDIPFHLLTRFIDELGSTLMSLSPIKHNNGQLTLGARDIELNNGLFNIDGGINGIGIALIILQTYI